MALPTLQLSGILALRKHCLGIIADSQLSAAKRYIDNDIPAVLGEAALWVGSGAGTASAEQKHQIRDTLDLIELQLKRVRESARHLLFYFRVVTDSRQPGVDKKDLGSQPRGDLDQGRVQDASL